MATDVGEVVLFDGGPGRRRPGDDLAPVFRLEVNDMPLSGDINDFVTSCEYESAVGMADLFRLVVDNPGVIDDFYPDWTAHKAFQPGNEASLFIGYGGRADRPENFIGRCQWAKHLPNYPAEGMPQLEVKGYSIDHLMMNNEGPITNGGKQAKPSVGRPLDEADNQGTVYTNTRHSEIIHNVADMYGMEKDIDETTRQENAVVKKGMKHYELVRGLGNLNNREFWVDYNLTTKKWVLHWKNINRNQQPVFSFRYNDGDFSTLLEAQPEYGLREAVTTATMLVFDSLNSRWVSAIQIEELNGPSPIYKLGGGLAERATVSAAPAAKTKSGKVSKAFSRRQAQKHQKRDVIDEAMVNPSQFRLAAAGVSIDVLAPDGKRFRDAEEAARWLVRWFQSKQDNFITVQGRTIGVEQLKARQCHTLKGMSKRLDGQYFFTRVRHVLSGDGLYECEFTANKVIE